MRAHVRSFIEKAAKGLARLAEKTKGEICGHPADDDRKLLSRYELSISEKNRGRGGRNASIEDRGLV